MDWFLPKIGSWSFIIGVVLAILSGFFEITAFAVSILIILGIIVGFLNVTGSKAMTFLLASVSLVIISSLGSPAFQGIPVIGTPLQRMLINMMIFVIPASIIVALRVIMTLAYKK